MEYQAFTEDLKRTILPVLEENNIEPVEFKFIKTHGRPILKLLVDKKGGRINLEECARLNKIICSVLDAQDTLKDGYILEVSSPGLDRPLTSKSDFSRCINRKARFFLKEAINGKIELEGIIEKIENDCVYIKMEELTKEVPLSKIHKAKQII